MGNSFDSYGPFLENLLDQQETAISKERVCLVDPAKQRALSAAYDLLMSAQRSAGMQERVEVKNWCGLGCACVTAVVPNLYTSSPVQLALAAVEASHVQLSPMSAGQIRASFLYQDYFHEIE